VTAISATMGPLALPPPRARRARPRRASGSARSRRASTTSTYVAPGYKAEVLIRWGDPVLPGAPEFDPMAQTAEKQRLQFGYNNDYLGYFPIDGSSEHGSLLS
jgi:secreted PhoX family phosphatase